MKDAYFSAERYVQAWSLLKLIMQVLLWQLVCSNCAYRCWNGLDCLVVSLQKLLCYCIARILWEKKVMTVLDTTGVLVVKQKKQQPWRQLQKRRKQRLMNVLTFKQGIINKKNVFQMIVIPVHKDNNQHVCDGLFELVKCIGTALFWRLVWPSIIYSRWHKITTIMSVSLIWFNL